MLAGAFLEPSPRAPGVWGDRRAVASPGDGHTSQTLKTELGGGPGPPSLAGGPAPGLSSQACHAPRLLRVSSESSWATRGCRRQKPHQGDTSLGTTGHGCRELSSVPGDVVTISHQPSSRRASRNRNLLSPVLEAKSPKSRRQQGSALSKSPGGTLPASSRARWPKVPRAVATSSSLHLRPQAPTGLETMHRSWLPPRQQSRMMVPALLRPLARTP